MEEYFNDFISNLNWTYAICYTIAIYGIKNVDDLKWYNNIFENSKYEHYKILFLSLTIMTIQCSLVYLEEGIVTPNYIGTLLRTWLTVSVFYSYIIKKIQIK